MAAPERAWDAQIPLGNFFRTSFGLEIVLESQRLGLYLSQLICWLCF